MKLGSGVVYQYTLTYSMSGVVSNSTGDKRWAGKPPRYATSCPGQLSLLPYVEQEISTGQSAVMLCGWGVKARWLMRINVWVADNHASTSSLTGRQEGVLKSSATYPKGCRPEHIGEPSDRGSPTKWATKLSMVSNRSAGIRYDLQ